MKWSVAFVAASVFLPSVAFAAVFKVNLADDLPDAKPGDGLCSYLANPPPHLASCTLRAAVMEANATPQLDYIQLADGVHYTLAIPGSGEDDALTGDLDIRFPVVLQAIWGNAKPIIDGGQLDRVFDIHPSAAGTQLVALKITGGRAIGAGGGIATNANDISLFLLDIYGNSSTGAGCGVRSRGTTRILLSSIFENQGVLRERCSAVHHAGTDAGELWVEGSSIYRNAGDGVVVDGVDARSTIVNSTLSGNTHYGVWFRDTNISIMNSTLADNGPWQGEGVGGGLLAILSSPKHHRVYMKNTILDGNRGQNCALGVFYTGDEYYFSWNVSDDGSCDQNPVIGSDNLHFTPAHLMPLGDWGGPTPTHKPDYNSPVIDRTVNDPVCSVYPYDQRLLERSFAFHGGKAYCDTGAVELQW